MADIGADGLPVYNRLRIASKVVELPVVTRYDIAVERVLARAESEHLDGCVVVGTRPDGSMFFACTYADGGHALWWLEKAKQALLNVHAIDKASTD